MTNQSAKAEQTQITKSKGQIKAKAQMTKLSRNWNFGPSHEIATPQQTRSKIKDKK
jgi:hypothetical protein